MRGSTPSPPVARLGSLAAVLLVLAPAHAFLPGLSRGLPHSMALRSTEFGDDFPSDTASDDIIGLPLTDIDASSKQREELKCRLFQLSALSNRGQLADLEQQNEALNIVAELEGMGPPPGTDWRDVNGRWELVWSDVAPFRISPFFLTLGKLFGEQRAAEDFFRLHRLATSGSEIGRARQIITSSEVASEIEISTGLPSIPFAIKGTVVTRASATKDGDRALRLQLKSTGVTDSNLFSFINGGNLPELPVGELIGSIGALPSITMSTDYVDGDLRISRAEDDHYYVFVRSTF